MKYITSVGAQQSYDDAITLAVKNNTGTTIAPYSALLIDTTNYNVGSAICAVTISATTASTLVLGVLNGTTLAITGNYMVGEAVIKGFTKVLKYAETWAVGDRIVTDGHTAGLAAKTTTPSGYAVRSVFGVCTVVQAATTDTYGYIYMP